jgi:hypothetical protein
MSRTITAVKNNARQKWRRWLATTIVGLTLMVGSQFADAADALSIANFVGHFRGEAQVQAGDRFFIQQLRDTDVDLRAEDDVFRLRWTTVIHSNEGERFTENATSWASIDGNRLVVHVSSIMPGGNCEL